MSESKRIKKPTIGKELLLPALQPKIKNHFQCTCCSKKFEFRSLFLRHISYRMRPKVLRMKHEKLNGKYMCSICREDCLLDTNKEIVEHYLEDHTEEEVDDANIRIVHLIKESGHKKKFEKLISKQIESFEERDQKRAEKAKEKKMLTR